MTSFRTLLLFAFLACGAAAGAQAPGKKQLTQADYDIWRSIQNPLLSDDGRWAAYTLAPLVGEQELIVRSTSSATEYRHSRGYIPPPAGGAPAETGGPGEEGGAGGGAGVTVAQFSAD